MLWLQVEQCPLIMDARPNLFSPISVTSPSQTEECSALYSCNLLKFIILEPFGRPMRGEWCEDFVGVGFEYLYFF